MTQAEVQAVILGRISSELEGVYPDLLATPSMEDAVLAHKQERQWALCTLKGHDPNQWQGEDNWEFMIQASCSLEPGAQTDTLVASAADEALCAALRNAINDDEGYAYLRDAGVLQAEIKGLPEDQQSETYINPHVLTCSTY